MSMAARRIAALLIALFTAAPCAHAAAALRGYHCSIALESGNRARVAADLAIGGVVAGSSLEFTRIAYPGQRVSGLPFVAGPPADGSLERYRVEVGRIDASGDPTVRRHFEYLVEPASRDGVAWIPLVVPDPPAEPGAGAVELEIHLGSGMAPVGDTFPRFSWTGGNIGKAVLSNVPAFVRVTALPAAEASSIGNVLRDAAFLNDAAIILLLVAGSALWWARSRRP